MNWFVYGYTEQDGHRFHEPVDRQFESGTREILNRGIYRSIPTDTAFVGHFRTGGRWLILGKCADDDDIFGCLLIEEQYRRHGFSPYRLINADTSKSLVKDIGKPISVQDENFPLAIAGGQNEYIDVCARIFEAFDEDRRRVRHRSLSNQAGTDDEALFRLDKEAGRKELDRLIRGNSKNDAEQKGLKAEIENRKSADNNLEGKIDGETRARNAADERLEEELRTETEGRKSADERLESKIADETRARVEADSGLTAQLKSDSRDIALIKRKLRARAFLFIGIPVIFALLGFVVAHLYVKSALTALEEELRVETENRKSADNNLEGKIDGETRARNAADERLEEELRVETEGRKSADERLEGKIDGETRAERAADSELRKDLNDEGGGSEGSVED